jgi:hypothetical protein
MGFKDFIGGAKPKGYQCTPDENGNQVCDIFEVHGNQKTATGSHISLSLDPKTCDVIPSADTNSILDSDREMIKQIIADKKAECRRGVA